MTAHSVGISMATETERKESSGAASHERAVAHEGVESVVTLRWVNAGRCTGFAKAATESRWGSMDATMLIFNSTRC